LIVTLYIEEKKFTCSIGLISVGCIYIFCRPHLTSYVLKIIFVKNKFYVKNKYLSFMKSLTCALRTQVSMTIFILPF